MFSLCYTTVRKQAIGKVLRLWYSQALDKACFEFIICVDAGREDCAKEASFQCASLGIKHKIVVQETAPFNCVRGWNEAARHASGMVLIAVSDDFTPPEHWDDNLLHLSPPEWYKSEWAVLVADGLYNELMTLGIITQAYYRKFGYMYYPNYESMYSDTEMTYRAVQDGVLLDARHLTFKHDHYSGQGGRVKDAHDEKHGSDERYARGRMLFETRQNAGFPIDEGPLRNFYLPDENTELKYIAYMQCIKDDFHLFEICKRLVKEGVKQFYISIPDHYWSGVPTIQAERDEVIAVAKRIATELRVSIGVHSSKVGPYLGQGSRIQIETKVRNNCLRHIRSMGFAHVLVVDGDELWKPGTLRKIDAAVKYHAPTSLALGMIPVVGLPGFPVRHAADGATCYMRTDITFSECRTPFGTPYRLTGHDIFHFTAIRKNGEDLVKKLRDSGHYDDPMYDFEGFISRLQSFKPGDTNIHMYKQYQIWPELGKWTEEELAIIPEPIKALLG